MSKARIVTGLHSRILDCCFKLNRVKDYGKEILAQKDTAGRTSSVSPWTHRQFIDNFLSALEKGYNKGSKGGIKFIEVAMDCCGRKLQVQYDSKNIVQTYFVTIKSLEDVMKANLINCENCMK